MPRSGSHCLENGFWISLDFSKYDMIDADLARWPKPYHIHRGGQQWSGWGRGRCWRPTISWRQPRGPSCKISPARNWLNDTYDEIGILNSNWKKNLVDNEYPGQSDWYKGGLAEEGGEEEENVEGEGEKWGERADKEIQKNSTTLKKETTLWLPIVCQL